MRRYIFSTNHKIVGLQYFWLAIASVLIGVALSLLMRFHLVNPGASVSWFGLLWPVGAPGGVMTPELYLSLMTMHGTIMVFFVLSLAPQSAFGNYFLPLQIGSPEMAFPMLSAVSFWLTAASWVLLLSAFFVNGGAPLSGWTAYPPLSAVGAIAGPGQGTGQTLWIVSICVFCLASMIGAINFIVTTLDCRAPGIRMMQLPLTCWNWLVTSVLILLGFAVLLAAGILLILDRSAGTSFFVPGGLVISDRVLAQGGGTPLLWQHLFWFFGHPEVYIAILPGMGLISEVIATFSRRPIFGYTTMVLATFAIAFLGLLVWGHHMFTSGMSPYFSIAFSVLTMTIGVPSAIKTFNWLGTLWGGRIEFTTAMLFALGFVSVFITGGLSGIFLGQPVLDLYFHDTYFVVAHFHLIMGVAAIFGIFAAVFYWFPRMFGRMLNETLGKIHFWGTFIGVYALFAPMHLAGMAGNPRRYPDFTNFEFLTPLMPIHSFMTWAAFITAAFQLVFFFNLFQSSLRGPRAPANPWLANTLEWKSPESLETGALMKSGRTAFTGLLALITATTMLFAALTSAYIVRRGLSNDWISLQLPSWIWASPILMIVSAAVIGIGRWRFRWSWFGGGIILGSVFVLIQSYLWIYLLKTGVSAGDNPAAAFFYVLSGALILYTMAALLALVRTGVRAYESSYLWCFVSGLWICFFLLLRFYA